MDTKLLRQKILDLAIRGKLVPQDPNDEPASVLLERIKAEKEQLIKEGKIKRSKKTATTSDSRHYPFDLPSGWVWCRLGEINDIARGGSPRPIKNYITDDPNGVNWIKIGDTTKNSKYIETVKEKIRIEGVRKSRKVFKGDFLLTNSMSFGRPYILKVDGCIHDGWLVISPYGNAYTTDFLYYLLSSNFAYEQFSDVASGGVVTNLNSDKVADTFFPLPSISEQERIVKDIENMFSIIDMIEANSTDLLSLIKYAKNKILDLAIHGKLVPQDPADEPASELLKRVNPSAEITCDNEHYPQLPNGWILLKGKYVFNPLKSTKPKTDIFKYIDIDSIDNKKQCVRQIKKLAASTAPSRASRYTRKGDVLFAMVRPYLKNIAIVPESDCIASTGFYICSSNGIITTDYCYYLMSSDYVINGLNQYMKGDNSPSISKNDIENWEFPIPPINEQIRITESIKILFSKIDNIAENL